MIRLIKRMKLRGQQGFTLVEVLIALAILGLVGVSAMSAINVSSRTILTSREQTIAESLTRSAIEYAKQIPYDSGEPFEYIISEDIIDTDGPPYYGEYRIGDDPDVNKVSATLVEGQPGLQKITVKVYRNNRLISATEAYKVNR